METKYQSESNFIATKRFDSIFTTIISIIFGILLNVKVASNGSWAQIRERPKPFISGLWAVVWAGLFVANFLCDEIAFQIGILFPKLFSPAVRKNCSKGREILFANSWLLDLNFRSFSRCLEQLDLRITKMSYKVKSNR